MLCVPAVALTDDRRRRHSRVLRDALRHADISLDQAAREMDRDVRQVGRWLDLAEGSLPLLGKLPDSFFSWLGVTLLREFGAPEELTALEPVRKRRMARMAGDTADSERRTA